MPQFDFYSFSGQSFWFLSFFLLFYFTFLYFYIPVLSEVIKLRIKLIFMTFSNIKDQKNINNKILNLFYNFSNILL